MGTKPVLMILGVLVLALVGCAGKGMVPGAEVTPEGRIVFRAEASTVVAKENDPLALIEAETAAGIMARADLLAKIKGVTVTGKAKVDDLMLRSQEATVTVEGRLARTEVTYIHSAQPPGPTVVRAVATLELTRRDLRRLSEFVQ
jgi:hypothetical protein